MITFENVSRRFGQRAVLEKLSFALPEHGIVALMGPSGIGKTTLLRLIAGLDKPDEGVVSVRAKKIAVSFQEPRLIPWLSCAQNLAFVLPKGESAPIEELLRTVELAELEDALPDTLSGGMKQRLSLARALALKADLLLLDEPFSAMDTALKQRLYPVIKNANPDGLTVIITHDEQETQALGAQVLFLQGEPVNALTT